MTCATDLSCPLIWGKRWDNHTWRVCVPTACFTDIADCVCKLTITVNWSSDLKSEYTQNDLIIRWFQCKLQQQHMTGRTCYYVVTLSLFLPFWKFSMTLNYWQHRSMWKNLHIYHVYIYLPKRGDFIAIFTESCDIFFTTHPLNSTLVTTKCTNSDWEHLQTT